ncbi:MAG: methyltransferase domain-containing protein [Gemmatimonadota bacterium]
MTAPETPTDPWSAVAKAYLRNIAPGFKSAVERLCRYAGIKKGDRVLDIGCGPGTASFAAVHQGADVTGIDSAPEMIRLAKEIANTRREYTFLEGDMHALPVPDASFEVVISSFGVVFSTNPPKVAAEMGRVLVPGGRIALLVWPRVGALARYYELLDKHLPTDGGRVDHHRWADLNLVRGWLAADFDAVASADIEIPFTAKTNIIAWDTLKVSTARVADTYAKLQPEAQAACDKAMQDFFRGHRQPDNTIVWPRKALMIRATKRVVVVPKSDTTFRSAIAVLSGYLASAVPFAILKGIAASVLLPAVPSVPSRTFLLSCVGVGLIAGIPGGWLGAKLAPNKGWVHVGIVAAVFAVLSGLTVSGLPLWTRAAIAGTGALGVAIGGLILLGVGKKP